ncbi:MAG TPA: DNA polymerase II, partial [Candidatus Poseidoniia archaeon]|nr:DNA polymerase II [Candidatus Poseidoniia archaeon]
AARETARDWVARVAAGKVAPEELVISKTVNLGRKYKNPKAMAHLQAHAKFVETGRPFVSGMKVAFIVTDTSRTPMVVEPFFPGEEPAVPDWDYYAGRLAKSLARITEVFGWDERALRTGGRQATLFSAASDEAATGKPTTPEREPQGEQQRLF